MTLRWVIPKDLGLGPPPGTSSRKSYYMNEKIYRMVSLITFFKKSLIA